MSKNMWRRFAALFLMVVMTLNYLPLGAVAQTGNADPVSMLLQVDVEKEETTVSTSAPTTAPGEETLDESTTTAPVQTIVEYVYTATLLLDGKKETSNVAYVWNNEKTGSEFRSENTSAQVKMTYDGITLTCRANFDEGAHFEAEPAMDVKAYADTVKRGVALATPEASTTNGGQIQVVWNAENQVVEELNGKFVPTTVNADNVKLADVQLCGASGTVYVQQSISAKVVDVEFSAELSVGSTQLSADNTYYSAEKITNIAVTLIPSDKLVDKKYLPTDIVKVGEEVQSELEWNIEGGVAWKTTVALDGDNEYKVTVLDKTYTVVIDTLAPQFEGDVFAYLNNGKLYVKAKPMDDKSGIKALMIGGQDAKKINGKDLYIIDAPATAPETIEVYALNQAGVKSEVKNLPVQPLLTAALQVVIPENQGGTIGGYTFILKDQEIRVTVEGATDDKGRFALDLENTALTYKDKDGQDKKAALDLKYYEEDKTWKATFKATESMQNLTFSAKDAQGRSASADANTTYIVANNQAPIIDTSKLPQLNKDDQRYYTKDQYFTITVSDTNLAANNGSVNISYKLGNVEHEVTLADMAVETELDAPTKTYSYAIDMQDGQVLSDLVITAKDNVGNESNATPLNGKTLTRDATAPVVDLKVEAVADGKSVAVQLYAGVENGEPALYVTTSEPVDKAVTVKLVATIEDANLDSVSDAFNKDEASGKWIAEYTFANKIKLDFTSTELQVKDKAGNYATDSLVIKPVMPTNGAYSMVNWKATGNKYVFNPLALSHTTAEANGDAPVVTLTVMSVDNWAETVLNNVKVGNQLPKIALKATASDKNNSIQTVSWQIQDTAKQRVIADSADRVENINQAEYTKTIVPQFADGKETGETTGVVLTVTVEDKSGNTVIMERTLGVDNQAPTVTVENSRNYVNEKYLNGDQVVTVTVKDMCVAENTVTVKKDNAEAPAQLTKNDDGSYTATVSFSEEGTHSLEVTAKDALGNTYDSEYSPKTFIIDTTKPTVEVTETMAEGGSKNTLTADSKAVNFFDTEVKYDFTVTEVNLDPASVLTYTLVDTDGTATEVSSAVKDWTYDEQAHTYKTSVTVLPGQALINVAISVKDLANWTADAVTVNDCYVDDTAPVVEVTLTDVAGEGFTELNGREYYNGDVKILVKITDDNLWNMLHESKPFVTLDYSMYDESESKEVSKSIQLAMDEGGFTLEDGVYTYEIVLENGDVLTAMSLSATDNAGNKAAAVAEGGMSFKEENGVLTYDGKPVANGGLAPLVTVEKTVQDGAYFQVLEKDGVDYNFYNGTVTYNVTVRDADITAASLKYTIVDEEGTEQTLEMSLEADQWIPESINEYTEVLTYPIVVNNGQTLTAIELTAKDFLENVTTSVDVIEDNIADEAAKTTFEDMKYTGNNVYVDTVDPVVKVTLDTPEQCYVANSGIYYPGDVTFHVEVSDKMLWNLNGRHQATLSYTIWDANVGEETTVEVNLPATGDTVWEQDGDRYTYSFTITALQSVTAMSIKAVDNAGNAAKVLTDSNRQVCLQFNAETCALESRDGWRIVNGDPAPEAKVSKVVNGTLVGLYTRDDLTYELYNGEVTYTFTVTDAYFVNDKAAEELWLEYTALDANGNIVTNTIDIDQWTHSNDNAKKLDTYTCELKVESGVTLMDMVLMAKDSSGLIAQEVKSTDPRTTFNEKNEETGTLGYDGQCVRVDASAPVVKVTLSDEAGAGAIEYQNKLYYQGGLSVQVEVTDIELRQDITGEQELAMTYTTVDQVGFATPHEASLVYTFENNHDRYTYTIELGNEETLTAISIVAVDNVGHVAEDVTDSDLTFVQAEESNALTYNGLPLVNGSPAPQINVERLPESGEWKQTVDGIAFINNDVTYRVTVTDAYLTNAADGAQRATLTGMIVDADGTEHPISASLDDQNWTYIRTEEGVDTYTYDFTLSSEQTLTALALDVKDNANLVAEVNTAEEYLNLVLGEDGVYVMTAVVVRVDNTPADIVVDITTPEVGYVHNNHSYFQGEVTVDFTVTDANLWYNAESELQKVELNYTIVDGKTDVETDYSIVLPAGENSWELEEDDGYTYRYTIVLEQEQMLKSGFKVTAVDNAGNTKEYEYTENHLVNGDPPPHVTVSKKVDGAYAQTLTRTEGEDEVSYDFYNGTVTYTITATDAHMNQETSEDSGQEAVVSYALMDTNGNVEIVTKSIADWSYEHKDNLDTLTFEVVVDAGYTLTDMRFGVKDNAGLAATMDHLTVTDTTGLTTFAYDEENLQFYYIGHHVTADNAAPTVDVKINSAVEPAKSDCYYYPGAVSVDITITDHNLWNMEGKLQQAMLNYTVRDVLTGTSTDTAIQLGAETAWMMTTDGKTYTHTIDLPADHFLTDLSLVAIDNANNVAQSVTEDSIQFRFDADTRALIYDDLDIANGGLAPTVKVEKTVANTKEYIQSSKGHDFYNGTVTYSFTIEDVYMTPAEDGAQSATLTYTLVDDATEEAQELTKEIMDWTYERVTNSETKAQMDTFKTSIQVPAGFTMTTLKLTAKDNAGQAAIITENPETNRVTIVDEKNLTTFFSNGATLEYIGNNVTVDNTAPTMKVTKNVATPHKTSDERKVEYYGETVTYQVEISDDNLWYDANSNTQFATLQYSYEDIASAAEDKMVTRTVTLAEGWTLSDDGKTFTYSFTLEDGMVLKTMSLIVIDNAKNKATSFDSTGITLFAAEGDSWKYVGKAIAVDTTAPKVEVNKTLATGADYIQTFNDRDYYDGTINYSVIISDAFLNEDCATAVLNVYYQNKPTDEINLFKVQQTKADDQQDQEAVKPEIDTETISYTHKIVDGDMMTGMTLTIIDNAGNVVESIKVSDPLNTDEETYTGFAFVDGENTMSYTGRSVICDATAPTATLKFSDNVQSFYYNTKNNTVYAVLDQPVVGESGKTVAGDPKQVTMTVTVEDLNLTLDAESIHRLGVNSTNGSQWVGNTTVNANGTMTYTMQSTQVNPDGTAVFDIDVKIVDVAGNVIQDFDAFPTASNEYFWHVDASDAGDVAFHVSVDRLRPGIEGVAIPTIEITPSIKPTKTAGTDLDLFNGAFEYSLRVTDGENTTKNAGIKEVYWQVLDKNGVVATNERTTTNTEPVHTGNYAIAVGQGGANGESNDVAVKITVTDFAHNQISYMKPFAYDTLAPRVKITQSNHSVLNDFYFKDNQVVTVDITELNFDPQASTIKTEIPVSAWTALGNSVYRVTLAYTQDGDYTFEMATTDLASNKATIDYTTGLTALQKFTIDKTAPVITVTYNPAQPVNSKSDIAYFNTDRTMNAQIVEHNFNASEVKYSYQTGRTSAFAPQALSWSVGGDTHVATKTYTEGNEYKGKIEYTDLAGNPAETYTDPTFFTVDKTKPTIAQTTTLIDGQTVSGTLDLVFKATDLQSNLKDFNAVVSFTNNEFMTETRTGVVTSNPSDSEWKISFVDIDYDKVNDGTYHVMLTAADYSNNAADPFEFSFSLNRHGSTFYTTDKNTQEFFKAGATGLIYKQLLDHDLVIYEKNPSQVWTDATKGTEGSLLTISVNGKSWTLTEGTDYDMIPTTEGTNEAKWHVYKYVIHPSVFLKDGKQIDGEYVLRFFSVDEGDHENSNETTAGSALIESLEGESTGKVSFILDQQKPIVTIIGLETGLNRYAANVQAQINVSDNSPHKLTVLVNGAEIPLLEEMGDINADWFYFDATTGSYVLNLSAKQGPQTVSVSVSDEAGNADTIDFDRITISTNWLILFWNSTPAKLIAGGVLLLLAALIVLLILMKKRKKNNATPAE